MWLDEVLLKVYVKEKHNLPEVFNFFVICSNLKKFSLLIVLSKANFGGESIAVLMVLDKSLHKVLPWSFMGLIRCELYYFGIRIQKIVFPCLYKSKTNYIRLNSLNAKKTTGAKISPFVICIEAIIYLFW